MKFKIGDKVKIVKVLDSEFSDSSIVGWKGTLSRMDGATEGEPDIFNVTKDDIEFLKYLEVELVPEENSLNEIKELV